ncbi:hypothetical protein [Luteipulveratus halotolerans]|uniref:Uncharacterized protein n=1 Tax=Luteipulveratus halotolerans TaxID=1631356 RepID=A0A0L6CJY7_9MICO|nr:hypothetical protein [Luteipulveratus halotolerans]KNX37930.1 hypothetical protein VV01_13445 [Luteipulveratus halotolerans]
MILAPDEAGVEVHTTSAGREDIARGRDYSSHSASPPESTTPHTTTGFVPVFQAERAPWVAGLGWAPAGKDWLVVRDARAHTSRFSVPSISAAGGEDVQARAAGPGRLDLTVSDVGAPSRTVGTAAVSASSVTRPTAAYVIDSDASPTISLTYTQRLVADPTDKDAAAVTAPVTAMDSFSRTVPPT